MSGATVGPLLVVGLGLAASVSDLARRRVSNWITGCGVVAGLVVQSCTGGWRGLAAGLIGASIGFLVLLPLQVKGAMGGGDVKLMAAFGAMLGPAGVAVALLFGAVAGGLLAAVWILSKPRVAAIPYAPALALGAWISWWGGGR